jgi:bacterioferritin (cytochrome b1)
MEKSEKKGQSPVAIGQVPEYYFIYGPDSGGSGEEISPVERLLNEFEAHENEEEKVLKEYRKVAAEVQNPLIKTLLELIITDEEKHRVILHSMLSTLRGDLNWTRPEDAITGLYEIGAAKETLVDATEAFIRLEKEGMQECRGLVTESKRYHQGVFTLLLRCMMNDSEKHIDILEFLKQTLKHAR